MPSYSPNVAAPLWAASQASPWLVSNMAARIFDAFCSGVIVESMALTAPPVSCADGSKYLVHGTATGLWAGEDGKLAISVGANAVNGWQFATVAVEGMLLRNKDDDRNYRYTSGVWTAFADAVSRFEDLLDVDLTGLADGMVFAWDASNGVVFPISISALVGSLAGISLDTDGTLAANSDSRVASQKAVKTFVTAAVTGLLDLKGGTDCSGNPNFPAASKGDYYWVTVDGKIGGGAGRTVSAGDIYFALADNAGGTLAAVGSSWEVMRSSTGLVGASRLQDLTDVDLSGLADGLVLKWDASNGVFYFADSAPLDANLRPTESFIIACSDETTALTAGTGKVTFRMPYAFTVTEVRASLVTAQASGSIFTVDINESGTSIISTKLTIKNTEKTSVTAAAPAVISDPSIADDAEITVDIDQIGNGSAKGLKIALIGHRT